MKILAATAACTRRMMSSEQDYDTIAFWIEMIQKVTGIDGYYLYLNDIEISRRSELFCLSEEAGIDYDYQDLGFSPDNRSNSAREPSRPREPTRDNKSRTEAIPGREYERFVVTRNPVIEYALKNNYDYLFNVDSDVICRPYTVERLLVRMKPGVAMAAVLVNNLARYISRDKVNIFRIPEPSFKWNVCDLISTPGRSPFIKHTQVKKNTVMDVDISGACCIIDLEPFKKHGIKYECDRNGEDANICGKLKKLGYKIILDTADDLECLHLQELWIMQNEQLINSYLRGERPDYFKFRKNVGGT